ncbi:TPA: hypothetical protein MAJ88_003793 [Klebsiella pneumoniae]|uniref:hypothetical protein n=1 Tax=Klebsiella pneumoniae TaxID=573 RepID=UPI000D654E02|nr:hypothetical protein [Klebsiella pneumoniae]MBK2567187.1 hypothetical protein [Klebsiella pneumoniae]GKP54457.1 hypothetical protein NUBL1858_42880 [Klebsiella pneumoniae]HBQ1019511.1 hypothetical protein [Klebsiella pneumoniae]HBS5547915.1 hypothetical protein [Klebsiella pneumoniae]
MNISTVNELISTLESAGELSIREQKFLKLAKAHVQLAAENAALKESRNNLAEFIHEELDADYPLNMNLETHATDRIVAGFKADGVAEREKTITFTAAKKRTQDGVALIAIGKPYKIHNDDVIGEFFIGERGRYGVITMDRINYFTTSDEYAWEFSLREVADK